MSDFSFAGLVAKLGKMFAPQKSIRPKARKTALRPVVAANQPDIIKADHWRKVNSSVWPSKNFTPRELASKGNGAVRTHTSSLMKLQALRDLWGRPMVINSGYRDPAYNRKVGGAVRSQHKEGKAFDISVRGLTHQEKRQLVGYAYQVGFTAFGGYNTFLHVDDRDGAARWGQSWAHP